jgi:hypothetical protein
LDLLHQRRTQQLQQQQQQQQCPDPGRVPGLVHAPLLCAGLAMRKPARPAAPSELTRAAQMQAAAKALFGAGSAGRRGNCV